MLLFYFISLSLMWTSQGQIEIISLSSAYPTYQACNEARTNTEMEVTTTSECFALVVNEE